MNKKSFPRWSFQHLAFAKGYRRAVQSLLPAALAYWSVFAATSGFASESVPPKRLVAEMVFVTTMDSSPYVKQVQLYSDGNVYKLQNGVNTSGQAAGHIEGIEAMLADIEAIPSWIQLVDTNSGDPFCEDNEKTNVFIYKTSGEIVRIGALERCHRYFVFDWVNGPRADAIVRALELIDGL